MLAISSSAQKALQEWAHKQGLTEATVRVVMAGYG